MIESADPHNVPGGDGRADRDAHRQQVRVRGSHPAAVVDCHRQAPGNGSGERNEPRARSPDRTPRVGRQVDSPVTAKRTCRRKRPNHLTRERRLKRAREPEDDKEEEWRQRRSSPYPDSRQTGRGQAMPTASSESRMRDRATVRRSSGRNGLVRNASAPPRLAFSFVSSCA